VTQQTINSDWKALQPCGPARLASFGLRVRALHSNVVVSVIDGT